MKVINAQNITPATNYGRLLESDITRLPSLNINRADYYQGTQTNKTTIAPQKKSDNFWSKFFTLATFGLTGLYIAHRNNLFNPVKREARKIVKSPEIKEKVLDFVESAINPETYKTATKNLLNKFLTDKYKTELFIKETKKILNDNSALKELFEKVNLRLADEADNEGLKKGFAVDILDRLGLKIEKNLAKAKNHGLPYKNQKANVIETIFAKQPETTSMAEETLFEAINNRSELTVENFIRDSLIKTQLENRVHA